MKRFETTANNEPGKGILICTCYHQQSKFERIHAQYPLKFIPTQGHADRLAVVYMLSYGGGIVSGDTFHIDMTIKENAILLLMTQGNTKVFKDRHHHHLWLASINNSQQTLPIRDDSNSTSSNTKSTSIQIINSVVASQATLLVLPDPVTCFRDSSFQSRQVFHLADEHSQLVLLDWFTSGRMKRGENWSFRHYSSRIEVRVADKLVVKDAMVLEDEEYMKTCNDDDDETAYASRLKPYLCFATLIMIASHQQSTLMRSVENVQRKAQEMRLMPLALKSEKDRELLWSVNPILKGKGVLVRIAGMTTESVRDFVKYQCLGQGFESIVGEGMFQKVLM
ncbi:UreD urease accessory protein-domain-containing protein [Cokeromyces recurvatus]|uniref:UreD urease accessory protein-domain-containing protein n=1 Tax=Cokeromyces recurvatus TaxID=90255 RepID=UPI00221E4D28|nr:UreD urease accessory protein-domain-containing protein [Cokeromyces recurvatus]KAI7898284.1 UreD urease accessory protein-domain-containing protein [Cokeromyces recurvatus]